jgi:DNA-binding response OmpR family regulator
MDMLKKILHVDDDPDIREIALIALEMVGGFTVAQCSSGQEALDCVVDFEPDLILLDVMMPDMDGVQTFQNIKKIDGLEFTPVIFVTARAHEESIAALLENGAAGVVTKPFDPMALGEQVQNIWSQTRKHQLP